MGKCEKKPNLKASERQSTRLARHTSLVGDHLKPCATKPAILVFVNVK